MTDTTGVTKRVFGYIRVSTGVQVANFTPENQHKAITDYAAKNGLDITETFEDMGLSGASPDRPGLSGMMARLHEVEGILVYDTTVSPATSR